MTLHVHNNKRGDQAGVTLLLAVLMLAAITTIVFGIAAFTINEIRSSAEVSRSAPSITGAQAVAEENLFVGVRGIGALPECDNPDRQVLANKVTVSSCASYYEKNPYSLSLSADQRADLYMVNPSDQQSDPGYTEVAVSLNTANGEGRLYFCSMETENCVAGPHLQTAVLNQVFGYVWSSGSLDASAKYQIAIVNVSSQGNYTVVSAPYGLPSGYTTIENTGTHQGTTRKLRTTFPQ
jgi:hypothetical protein